MKDKRRGGSSDSEQEAIKSLTMKDINENESFAQMLSSEPTSLPTFKQKSADKSKKKKSQLGSLK